MSATSDCRQQARDIYAFISEQLYLGRPDLDVQGERINSTLLLSLLTALGGGKALLIGEPGLGKTTAAEYVCTLVYGVPLGVIWSSVVAGHPEQTEEKIIGRPNLGKLSQGEEEVVWSYFARLPVKIVDEINRLPETKQSLILDGIERGKWEYLNKGLINDEFCLFATANYQDQGTNALIPPLLDRFDVLVESKHPGANISYLIGQTSSREAVLRHSPSEAAFLDMLQRPAAEERKQQTWDAVYRRYRRVLRDRCGVAPMSRRERQVIRQEMASLEVDLAANTFMRMVLAEFSFCCKYGQKRSGEVCGEGCHYTGYLCYEVRNCASNRMPGAIKRYAQALAWWLGETCVKVEHVRTILPYVLSHRIQWRDSYLLARERENRLDPLPLHAARQATMVIFRRFHEQRHDIMQALHIAARMKDGEDLVLPQGDHPLYAEMRRDLALEAAW